MAFGLNRAELIGRLGADVTINHLASGGRVANLSIATDEGYVDKQSGDRVEKTEWHRVVTFQPGLVDMFDRSTRRRAASSTSRASSRPAAGRRTRRIRIGSRPRSSSRRAGACSSWTR